MPETVAEKIRSRLHAYPRLPDPSERRALREAAGLSQQEMADILGVTRAAISNYEAGSRSPRGRLLTDYADALRVLKEAA